MNNVKNLKVNSPNLEKNRQFHMSLKKVVVTGLTVLIAAGISTGLYKSYKNVQPPEGFNFSGDYVEVGEHCDLSKKVDDDFLIVEINDWKKGISESSTTIIDGCNLHGKPCGVIINTESTTVSQAKADAMCTIAFLEDKDIDCKVYYNIDKISDKLSREEIDDISGSFLEVFTIQKDTKYQVALAGNEDNLKKLGPEFQYIDKLVMTDEKTVSYNGNYNMCYFTRTGELFTSLNYCKSNNEIPISVNIETPREDTIKKGIDVSQFQGDIDWDQVKASGIEYANIRFSEYNGFHNDGKLVIDTSFYENVEECERVGIPFGIYCYTKAETEAEAIEEANALVDALNESRINPSLPIYYDIEMEKHKENPELSARLCHAFIDTVKENGYESAIYCSYSFMRDMYAIDPTVSNPNNWIAYYKHNEKRGFEEVLEEHIPQMENIGQYGMIQVTANAVLGGIEENTVDVNFSINDTLIRDNKAL